MKEHILREMVNELRQIAVMYHKHQCLRELISVCVNKYLDMNVDWYANNPDDYPSVARSVIQVKELENDPEQR